MLLVLCTIPFRMLKLALYEELLQDSFVILRILQLNAQGIYLCKDALCGAVRFFSWPELVLNCEYRQLLRSHELPELHIPPYLMQ